MRQQQPGQLAADQRGGADAEKLLGRWIDETHSTLAIEREDRARQGGEQKRGVGRRSGRGRPAGERVRFSG